MTLEGLNALPAAQAEAELLACCGSRRWARETAARRPFGGVGALLAAADEVWWSLAPDDWHEAFRAHPRIGERKAERPEQGTERWSGQEQAGLRDADAALRLELADANRAYEERFGWIFLVNATGKTPDEMLALARGRLSNPPDDELLVAAEEQRRITRIRLEKLLAE